jgi:8-amino-7-oxononanoate synthase
LELHKELERRLAKFIGKEAAIVFSTGYQSNLGAITALMEKDDVAICDKDAHASLVDAVKMSGCQMKRFRHNDMADLERLLKDSQGSPSLVIVDGVYSMGGDLAKVPEIIALCKQYGARFFLDDAHGLGVMGPGGRGTAWHFNAIDDVDLVMGTFSKSFASLGGVIAGGKDVIDYIQHHARSFIFSASMPPANVAAVLACLDIIEENPSYVQNVHRQAAKVRTALREMGYNCGESVTPVVPVYTGSEMNTIFAWKSFYDHGIYVNPVVPPGVPPNKSLLRTSYMASHTDEQIERVIKAFYEVGTYIGLIEEKATA